MDHQNADAELEAARVKIDKLTIEDWQAHSAILKERANQLEQGWTPAHDDWHTASEWAGLITRYLGRVARADDFDNPLTLLAPERRAAAQEAAIRIGALAWALLAASYRGDLYESGARAIEPDDVPQMRLFEVRYWYSVADGGMERSDAWRIVARTYDQATDYFERVVAPTLPHTVDYYEDADGQRVYIAARRSE